MHWGDWVTLRLRQPIGREGQTTNYVLLRLIVLSTDDDRGVIQTNGGLLVSIDGLLLLFLSSADPLRHVPRRRNTCRTRSLDCGRATAADPTLTVMINLVSIAQGRHDEELIKKSRFGLALSIS